MFNEKNNLHIYKSHGLLTKVRKDHCEFRAKKGNVWTHSQSRKEARESPRAFGKICESLFKVF